MNVSKFFRRYSRILLMVFMSLLLVVFLVGDVLQNAAQRRANPKQKIGHVFGHDIYTTDLQNAQGKQTLLMQMGFRDLALLKDSLDVYLLIEEARGMGVRIGRDQVKNVLPALGITAERLAQLQQRTGGSYDSMFDVAGEWLAVLQLVSVQADALGESLPRAELAFRNQKEAADVKLSVLDARAFLSSVPEPTEDELQAFFEQTKDRRSSHTEDEVAFGYLLPDRVRLEYLTVAPEVIEPKIRRPRERELKTFFEDYADNYQKTVGPPDTQTAQPANQPTRVPMTYEEARESVRRDCRTDKAIREAQSLVNEIRHAAYLPWQAAPRGEDGFREPPPEGTEVSFEALHDRFSERYPVTHEQTELLDQEAILKQFDPRPDFIRQQMESLEPIYYEGQVQMTISELAVRVKGIFTPEPDDNLPVLNVREPSPVLISMDYNRGTRQRGPHQAYVFRVIAVAPEGPPASLDVVREQLVEDYRLLKAHELAGEHARRLCQRARQVGLASAVEEATGLAELFANAEKNYEPEPPEPGSPPPQRPQYGRAFGPNVPTVPFTRDSRSVQWVGQTQKVQREAFSLEQPPTADEATDHAVAAVEVANLFKWVVVELEEVKPLYAGEFAQQRPTLLHQGSDFKRAMLKWGWISPDNVRQRTGFEFARDEQADEPAEPSEP